MISRVESTCNCAMRAAAKAEMHSAQMSESRNPLTSPATPPRMKFHASAGTRVHFSRAAMGSKFPCSHRTSLNACAFGTSTSTSVKYDSSHAHGIQNMSSDVFTRRRSGPSYEPSHTSAINSATSFFRCSSRANASANARSWSRTMISYSRLVSSTCSRVAAGGSTATFGAPARRYTRTYASLDTHVPVPASSAPSRPAVGFFFGFFDAVSVSSRFAALNGPASSSSTT
mmetsp:Transcript_1730/g.6326  ORF Transcript_1730/g.6326 Transcript_1730/m.6326 type:complete len:229 (+) Transcript_1730:1407-2093(+)